MEQMIRMMMKGERVVGVVLSLKETGGRGF